nr:pentatricopeptide repeat-containing protein, chloroplastic [Quercus suber]
MARGYFRYNAPLQAILLFSDILCSGIVPDDHTFPSLLKACASSEVLQEGYARSSRPNEALSLFRELQVSDLKPTDVTLLSILSSCALLGALDLGRWRHEYVKIHGFDKYVKVKTALKIYLLRALDKLVKELKLVGYVTDISLVFMKTWKMRTKKLL